MAVAGRGLPGVSVDSGRPADGARVAVGRDDRSSFTSALRLVERSSPGSGVGSGTSTTRVEVEADDGVARSSSDEVEAAGERVPTLSSAPEPAFAAIAIPPDASVSARAPAAMKVLFLSIAYLRVD